MEEQKCLGPAALARGPTRGALHWRTSGGDADRLEFFRQRKGDLATRPFTSDPELHNQSPFAPQTANSHPPQLSQADTRHRTLPSLSATEEAALLPSLLSGWLFICAVTHRSISQRHFFNNSLLFSFFLSAAALILTRYFNQFSTLLSCVSICRHEP